MNVSKLKTAFATSFIDGMKAEFESVIVQLEPGEKLFVSFGLANQDGIVHEHDDEFSLPESFYEALSDDDDE